LPIVFMYLIFPLSGTGIEGDRSKISLNLLDTQPLCRAGRWLIILNPATSPMFRVFLCHITPIVPSTCHPERSEGSVFPASPNGLP
jgi:hypothetical protein